MSEQLVRYLNLPQIPSELISLEVESLSNNSTSKDRIFSTYKWTPASQTKIEQWCNENISENLVWGLQVITGDLKLHLDSPTKVKISYIFETGGDNVITEFYKNYNPDPSNLLHSIKIEPLKWHILNVGVTHRVMGIEPGKVRISLTGRIF